MRKSESVSMTVEEEEEEEEEEATLTPTSPFQGTPVSKAEEAGKEEIVASPGGHRAVLMKPRRDREEEYEAFYATGLQEKPSKGEVLLWFLYELCSYLVHTVLIPILFPLLISQIFSPPPVPPQGWEKTSKGVACTQMQMQLFEGLTYPSIKVRSSSFSPLEFTSISWAAGLILAAPTLGAISGCLDDGNNQQLIAAAATAVGAVFCLPVGFFKTTWVFPVYIAAIVAASTVAVACHTRHLGLMVQAFVGSTIRKSKFPDRRALAGWLTLYATAAGCLGSAIIATFTYHMLGHTERFLSLWVVSIFSGLIISAGTIHSLATNIPAANTASPPSSIPKSHFTSIFRYPHAAGSLAAVFFASFATMCIFTGGVLHLLGQLCLKPVNILYLWLTYFIFPLISLPLVQPLQQLIRADAVKMQLLGFLLSAFTSATGFYYRKNNWQNQHVLVLAAVQSMATGLLHAFGRVLLLDCSPAGKEGAFSLWFSWVRAIGTLTGFAVASVGHGNIDRSFEVAFWSNIVGVLVLTFGNISNLGGATAAGLVRNDGYQKGFLENGLELPKEEKTEP